MHSLTEIASWYSVQFLMHCTVKDNAQYAGWEYSQRWYFRLILFQTASRFDCLAIPFSQERTL